MKHGTSKKNAANYSTNLRFTNEFGITQFCCVFGILSKIKTKSCETTTIVKKSVNCCLLSNIADVQMVRSRLD